MKETVSAPLQLSTIPPPLRFRSRRTAACGAAALISTFVSSPSSGALIEHGRTVSPPKPVEQWAQVRQRKPKAAKPTQPQSQSSPAPATSQQGTNAAFAPSTGPISDAPPFRWAFTSDGYLLLLETKQRPREEGDLHFKAEDRWPTDSATRKRPYLPMSKGRVESCALPLLINALCGDIRVRNSLEAVQLLHVANVPDERLTLESLILLYDPDLNPDTGSRPKEFARRDLMTNKMPVYAAALEKARTIRNVRLYGVGSGYDRDYTDHGFPVVLGPSGAEEPVARGTRTECILKRGTNLISFNSALQVVTDPSRLPAPYCVVPMAEDKARELERSGDLFAFAYEISGALCTPEERATFFQTDPRFRGLVGRRFLVNVSSARLFLLRVPDKAVDPASLRVEVLKSTTYR